MAEGKRSVVGAFMAQWSAALTLAAIGVSACGGNGGLDKSQSQGGTAGGSSAAAGSGVVQAEAGESGGGYGGLDAGAGAGGGGASDAPVCGDEVVEPGECEPPGSALCSDDCVEVASPACFDCEQASACFEFSENCLAFEGEARSHCYDVHECVLATGCAKGDKTLTSCFCGALTTSSCIEAPSTGPAAPQGACAEVIRAALGGSAATSSQVLTRYLNVAFPGGAALARMNCDKLAPACLGPCGF